jgi:electron transfer flavoprotein alpha subunit
MVLVFVESPRGQFKKSALEAVTYGKKVAELLGLPCVALTLGTVKLSINLIVNHLQQPSQKLQKAMVPR